MKLREMTIDELRAVVVGIMATLQSVENKVSTLIEKESDTLIISEEDLRHWFDRRPDVDLTEDELLAIIANHSGEIITTEAVQKAEAVFERLQQVIGDAGTIVVEREIKC